LRDSRVKLVGPSSQNRPKKPQKRRRDGERHSGKISGLYQTDPDLKEKRVSAEGTPPPCNSPGLGIWGGKVALGAGRLQLFKMNLVTKRKEKPSRPATAKGKETLVGKRLVERQDSG